ncbi:LytTR family DNA-binding domain-containing protein [Planococcus donghaensis]|uniref:Histidine kinase n=1 Tax=Planococcus donghaensis TaxID=414778 RepID=A0A1C7EK63_9BACL|nr:LytTR family DNA-binding domain-containing protein [Planococcus donghaensis]ANU24209.1 histidine kinase [Planococcus donghaensis]
MKVSLNIDSRFEETKITIECKEMDDSIKSIIDFINGREETRFLVGRDGDMQHILKPADIHYFHANNDNVTAVTAKGEFRLKEKLYELEEMFPSSQFIRLSKSVIANLDELSRFEASFNGTLCVYFHSGAKEYVSRNYVNAIKESLKMNRRKGK